MWIIKDNLTSKWYCVAKQSKITILNQWSRQISIKSKKLFLIWQNANSIWDLQIGYINIWNLDIFVFLFNGIHLISQLIQIIKRNEEYTHSCCITQSVYTKTIIAAVYIFFYNKYSKIIPKRYFSALSQ